MTKQWDHQRERSNRFMLRALLWIGLTLGRSIARLVLFPIVAYFLVTGGESKNASRQYLGKVLGREPTWRDIAGHFHAFASVSLDRFFMLSGRRDRFDVVVHRPQNVYELSIQKRGFLLVLAHAGSFEVLRHIAVDERNLPLRFLIDMESNRQFMSVVRELHPEFADRVIDAAQSGPMLVLALKDALQQGNMVGIMADRVRAHERSVSVNFLGSPAQVPAGPWILAASLGVPVVLAFGLYKGGNRYEVSLEMFADSIELPRATREQSLQQCAQRYISRVEHFVRSAPHNWFNFYDYWADASTPD